MPQIKRVNFPSDQFPPKTPVENATDIRLESGGAVTPWSRWTYHLEAPLLLMRCDPANHVTTLHSAGGVVQQWHDPLEALRWLENFRKDPPSPGPPFKGGWVGYLSYDFGRLFEQIPVIARDDLHLPLFQFTYHDRLWALDRESDENFRVGTMRWKEFEPLIRRDSIGSADGALRSTFRRSEYRKAVQRCIDYIRAGDVFQINLSQRFTAPLREPPHHIYLRLHRKSPGWFGAYLGYGNHAIVSNSPELFLRVTPSGESKPRKIVARPIKGTRPRTDGMDSILRHSEKDAAELNMIIDLERNDLGRICETGSVKVVEPRSIEAHPTVYHGVATIQGDLRPDVDLVAMLRATFPGGSITGAPKIRAMQIIEELEPVRRGPYCGAIGFIGADGHIEFNIAIRTMVLTQGQVHISVGGGIVADSNPSDEYDETIVKALAMFNAVGIADDDLKLLR